MNPISPVLNQSSPTKASLLAASLFKYPGVITGPSERTQEKLAQQTVIYKLCRPLLGFESGRSLLQGGFRHYRRRCGSRCPGQVGRGSRTLAGPNDWRHTPTSTSSHSPVPAEQQHERAKIASLEPVVVRHAGAGLQAAKRRFFVKQEHQDCPCKGSLCHSKGGLHRCAAHAEALGLL